MRKLYYALALMSAVSLAAPASAEAASMNKFAFRHFSKAKFVSIGNRFCGRGGNPRACCIFNGGEWHLLPKPHCIFI